MARARGAMTPGRGRRWKATPKPNLAADKEGTRLLNLTVLRRLDPAVVDILSTAAHVAAYSFDVDAQRWSRKGVEGSLFVVKRNTQPIFQFVIMNRKNIENLVEDILIDFEYVVQVPYIMYRNAAVEVIGIWFYNHQECEEVADLLNRIHTTFSMVSLMPKFYSAAESDCEETEATPSTPSAEDVLEQQMSLTADDAESFFAPLLKGAECVGATTGGTGAAQQNHSIGMVPSPSVISSRPPALHSLLEPQTSSGCVLPLLAHSCSSAPAIQPATLVKPSLFCPVTSSQTTKAPAAASLSAAPQTSSGRVLPLRDYSCSSAPTIQPATLVKPSLFDPVTSSQTTKAPAGTSLPAAPLFHPPLTIQQPQSTSLVWPFPFPTAPLPPPYGSPLLQPLPPPDPITFLNPPASYGRVLTRDKVRGVLLRLVQNDNFIDMVYREVVKGQYF